MKIKKPFNWHLFYLSLIGGLIISTSFTSKQLSPTFAESSAISWNEALALKDKYLELAPMKIEYVNPSNPNTKLIKTLEAFKIKASDLIEIIQNNKSGNGYPADNVMFYMGAKAPASGYTLPSYQLIAVGMRNNQLMIPAIGSDRNDPNKSSVYDKADPCPPFCPNE